MPLTNTNATAGPNDFALRPLGVEDAAAVSALLRAQPPEYVRFFYAFGSSEEEIARLLAARERDVYSGMFWRGELVGFLMLRGWDAGYEVPSFGLVVGAEHRGFYFMRMGLEAAKLTCRLACVRRMMAKMHPDNLSPRGMRRFGFVQTGVEPETGNVIYHMDF